MPKPVVYLDPAEKGAVRESGLARLFEIFYDPEVAERVVYLGIDPDADEAAARAAFEAMFPPAIERVYQEDLEGFLAGLGKIFSPGPA